MPEDHGQITAALFDFGGVLTTSPFDAFNRYEERLGLPRDFIRTLNTRNPDVNAWAREHGLISKDLTYSDSVNASFLP